MNLVKIYIWIKNQTEVKSFFQEAGIGIMGYMAAIQLDWISEAVHWAIAVITAVSCYAGVHYFKVFAKWFDRTVLKIKSDGKN